MRIDGLLDYLRRRQWQSFAKQRGGRAAARGGEQRARGGWVDPVMLRRIIGNLVCNSLRHVRASWNCW